MLLSTTSAVAFRALSRSTTAFQRTYYSTTLRRNMASSASAMNDDTSPEGLLERFMNDAPTATLVGNNVGEAMHSLYHADAVCFDVDSTVIAEEGIDVLAEYLGKGEEVAALTKQAMEGGMKFQDALAQRLELLQPSRNAILQCLQEQPLQLTPGIPQLMSSLHAKNVHVYLVSGGFRIMIEPLAAMLNIDPQHNIVANTILFDTDGNYTGFDANEPTSQDMGKPKALQQLQDASEYKTMVMVGDGATDAQAKPPAKAFIGFGGVIERQAVKEQADWFVTDFSDMVRVVEWRE